MRREWTLKTGPTVEPVTVAELKLWLRIDGTAEDSMLGELIAAARQAAEEFTGRALMGQTWVLAVEGWTGWVRLPRPPLSSVVEVRSVADDGTVTAWDPAEYQVRNSLQQGVVYPRASTAGLVEIEFNAGYGEGAASVPPAVKNAVKAWAADLYENRAPAGEPPAVVEKALLPWKIFNP